jgi:hypothetical protein
VGRNPKTGATVHVPDNAATCSSLSENAILEGVSASPGKDDECSHAGVEKVAEYLK